MANEAIRQAAKENGLRLWEVAEILGVTDSTFSRKLRHELPSEQKQHIVDAIESAARWRAEKAAEYAEIRAEQ